MKRQETGGESSQETLPASADVYDGHRVGCGYNSNFCFYVEGVVFSFWCSSHFRMISLKILAHLIQSTNPDSVCEVYTWLLHYQLLGSFCARHKLVLVSSRLLWENVSHEGEPIHMPYSFYLVISLSADQFWLSQSMAGQGNRNQWARSLPGAMGAVSPDWFSSSQTHNPLFLLLFVCVLGSLSAWEQHITAPTEDSHSPAIATGPVLPDQHHLLEGSSLVGPAGTVCGTGIWPGLFCPVLVLLDVCRDTGPWREEGGREERLLCVQPRLRSHPGHPDCRADWARVTV